jgi:hypothetical protein
VKTKIAFKNPETGSTSIFSLTVDIFCFRFRKLFVDLSFKIFQVIIFHYFLKYFNVKLHINTKYFGETLEGTGQAEDYRLKLSHKKASQQYEVL